MEGFEECQKKFIRLHAEPGSIIISWVFPRVEWQVGTTSLSMLHFQSGVVEVTVGGRRLETIDTPYFQPRANTAAALYITL